MHYSLGKELRELGNLIRRKIDNSKVGPRPEELTGMNGLIIFYLLENLDKEVFQKDIEKEFSIRRSTVTGILQLMEAKKLIVRVPVDNDARLKKIILTEKSNSLINYIQEDKKMIDDVITKNLSKEEIEIFFNILNKIKDNLK